MDFSGHSTEVAPALLGSILRAPAGAGRVVEVEAYGGGEDAASHAANGPTKRSEIMFGTAGRLYVYLIYGMHHCANVVTGPVGDGQAVLIRAIEPIDGIDAMRANRPRAKRDVDLTNGPGKLSAALEIDRTHTGIDLRDSSSPIRLEIGEPVRGSEIETTTRIGISVAKERPWRWYLRGNEWVSPGRPS